jgi:hypothetical protein
MNTMCKNFQSLSKVGGTISSLHHQLKPHFAAWLATF